jgi:hypothetical protein
VRIDAEEIYAELREVLNALAGAHAFALQGIRKERDYWEGQLKNATPPTNSHSTVSLANGPPDAPSTVAYSKWQLGELPQLLAGGGEVMTRISHQWVISTFAEWDEHYRPRITEALGLDEPIGWPPFGDLRHFRNDVVHNRGRASREHSGKAQVFTDWFQRGEAMFFDVFKVAEFMSEVQAVESMRDWSDAPAPSETNPVSDELPAD